MERNQVIGFILIFATLLAWTMFNKPSEEELNRKSKPATEVVQPAKEKATAEAAKAPAAKNTTDSAAIKNQTAVYGPLAPASVGESKEVVLENDLIKIIFNTRGGYITSALLKNHYKTVVQKGGKETRELIKMLNNPKNRFEYIIPLNNGMKISTANLYFKDSTNGNQLILRAMADNDSWVEQKYTLKSDDYTLDYSIDMHNMQDYTDPAQKNIELKWLNHLSKYEKGEQFEQNYSTAYFKQAEKSRDYCSCVSDDTKTLNDGNLQWVAHTNQFFNTSLLAVSGSFGQGILQTQMTDYKTSDVTKIIQTQLQIPVGSGKFDMAMYIGPNEYTRLASFNNQLEEIIPFGSSIFGTINRWVIRPFFDFLSAFISNKGIVILVLIFLIKMLLYPLMYKMLHSQAKMGALKPELAQLKEKYKDDMQKQQMETMKVYREYGVSPFGGCLPMILQMPIWYALFRFFPASITFRQESFLWASDLSTYDVLFYLPFEIPYFGAHVSLFTLLWAVSTIIYTYYNMQSVDLSANPAMKYIQYIMPVMFLAFFNTYASGLTAYMFFSNLINILQTIVTKNYIFDEAKIRTELLKQKEKPKKKGGFQARLEEAMKQQQALQEQRRKNKK